MSRGYADYMKMQQPDPGSGKGTSSGLEDWSRVILLAILGLAALGGYIYTTHMNKPKTILGVSVSKTLETPFKASMEGKTVLRDSLLAVYRSWESYTPEGGIAAERSPEASPAPFDAREALELVRQAVRAEEMDREDMYGHPTRHFYGEIICGNGAKDRPSGYYFEYWADLRDLKAVRLIMAGACRDVAVDAKGDSISSETSLNIRFQ